MKKKLVLSIITLCMCVSLFGCSTSKEKANEEVATTSTGVPSSIDTSYHEEYVRNYMPGNNQDLPEQNYHTVALIPNVDYSLIKDFDFTKATTLEGKSWENFRDTIAAYAKSYEGKATAINLSFKDSPYHISCIGIGDDYSTWLIACGPKAWESGVVSTNSPEDIDGVITVSKDGKSATFTPQDVIALDRWELTETLPDAYKTETTRILQIGDYYIIRIEPQEDNSWNIGGSKVYDKNTAAAFTKEIAPYFKGTEIEKAKPGHVIFSFVDSYVRTNQNHTVYQIDYSTCIENINGDLACDPTVLTYCFEKDWAWTIMEPVQ